jgi:hypothetical protein
LLRALSGRPPIRGNTLGDVLRELRHGRIEDGSTVVPAPPRDVADLLRRALVVSKERRLAIVSEFVRVLAPYAR